MRYSGVFQNSMVVSPYHSWTAPIPTGRMFTTQQEERAICAGSKNVIPLSRTAVRCLFPTSTLIEKPKLLRHKKRIVREDAGEHEMRMAIGEFFKGKGAVRDEAISIWMSAKDILGRYQWGGDREIIFLETRNDFSTLHLRRVVR